MLPEGNQGNDSPSTSLELQHRKLLDGDGGHTDSGGFSLMRMLDGNSCSAHIKPKILAGFVWAAAILWMFLAIAIVCDDFFVASLEVISERLELSDDVAGATFMAAGSSAPELFTSIAGAFFAVDVEHDNAGPGTIVGSAVFNVAIIIGASVICARESLQLSWWPLARDSGCYTISILCFICVMVVTTPNRIDWWEGLAMACMYGAYITLMVYNQRISEKLGFDPEDDFGEELVNPEDVPAEAQPATSSHTPVSPRVSDHDGPDGNTSDVSTGRTSDLKPRNRRQRGSSLLTSYDERPHLVTHRPKGAGATIGSTSASPVTVERHPSFRTAALGVIAIERMQTLAKEAKEGRAQTAINMSNPSNATDATNTGEAVQQEEEEIKWYNKVVIILSYPFTFLFTYTIPDCTTDKWRNWYLVSFFSSIMWIGLISYLMVEFAIKLGRCLGVSTHIMGLTILAVGTSVPDAMSSILVAKLGKGNMAVSNALGSNIFDIQLGLGVPWFLSTLLTRQKPLPISTHGLPIYVLMLFGELVLFLSLVKFSKWTLHVWHGWVLLSSYLVYVGASIVIDYLDRGVIPLPEG
jgi:K+-dependent Na+/Ca+ exchanger-like protein